MELTMTTAINTATTGEYELTETELEHVSDGNEFTIRPNGVTHSDLSIQKLIDKATPKLF
jgi:type VI protein secretion system component Hcp